MTLFAQDLLMREVVVKRYSGGYYEKMHLNTAYFHKIVDIDGERCYLTLNSYNPFSSAPSDDTVTIEVNNGLCGLTIQEARLPLGITATIVYDQDLHYRGRKQR